MRRPRRVARRRGMQSLELRPQRRRVRMPRRAPVEPPKRGGPLPPTRVRRRVRPKQTKFNPNRYTPEQIAKLQEESRMRFDAFLEKIRREGPPPPTGSNIKVAKGINYADASPEQKAMIDTLRREQLKFKNTGKQTRIDALRREQLKNIGGSRPQPIQFTTPPNRPMIPPTANRPLKPAPQRPRRVMPRRGMQSLELRPQRRRVRRRVR